MARSITSTGEEIYLRFVKHQLVCWPNGEGVGPRSRRFQARVLGRSSIAEWASTRMLQGHGSRLESELGLLTFSMLGWWKSTSSLHRIPECLPAKTSSAQHESSKPHASAVCHRRERRAPYHLPGRHIFVLAKRQLVCRPHGQGVGQRSRKFQA